MRSQCASSQTLLRRLLVEHLPRKRIICLIPSRHYWKAYGFAEWLALRLQDIALNVEDHENENGQ